MLSRRNGKHYGGRTARSRPPTRSAPSPPGTSSPAISCLCRTCSHSLPVPAYTWVTRSDTLPPTHLPGSTACSARMCCTPWAMMRSACRRSNTPSKPARTRRSKPRNPSKTWSASWAVWGWGTISAAPSPPPTRTITAGPSGFSSRSSTPGSTPNQTRRAASPNSSPSWRTVLDPSRRNSHRSSAPRTLQSWIRCSRPR